jgi:hypothetical protein
MTASDPSSMGTAGTTQMAPLTVLFADAYGNGIPGRSALATAPMGAAATAIAAMSDQNGNQEFTIQLAPTVGSQVFTFTDAADSSVSTSFTFTAAAGAPSSLTIVSGDRQSGPAGTQLAKPLVVKVTDGNGLPVAGVPLMWAGTGVSGAASKTDANGQGSATCTLPATLGVSTITVTSSALPNASVTFAETALAGAASKLVLVSGSNQTAVAGQPYVVAFAVRAEDAHNNPVSGVTVQFAATSGRGSVQPASFTTGADGLAATQMTAGFQPGNQTYQATSGNLTPVTITVTATAQTVALLEVVSGNGQTGAPGSTLTSPFVVEALDQAGQPVQGATVTFTGPSGSSVTPSVTTSNALGEVTVTATLSMTSGAQIFTAKTGNVSVTLTATATTTAPTLSMNIIAGNNQSGPPGGTLNFLMIRVTNISTHQAVPGVTIMWSATNGGTIVNAQTTTDSTGAASTSVKLSSQPGPESVIATASATSPVLNSPLTFSVTAVSSMASTLTVVSGGGQSAPAGSPFTNAFQVKATDSQGNPVSGATITFSVISGGGQVNPVTVMTDAAGLAQTQIIAGSVGGTNVDVFQAALGGTMATVQVTDTVEAAGVAVLRVVSGSGQTANPGDTLPLPLVVQALDSSGNPVSGATITFRAPNGGRVSSTTVTTNAQGDAQVTGTLGTATGTQTFTATTGSATATFSETASGVTTGQKIVIVSGNNQTGEAGSALAAPLVVEVTNNGGGPLSGVTVTWAAAAAQASVSASTIVTNAMGLAQVTATLGQPIGSQSFTAACAMCTGSPATFTEKATAGPASQLVIVSGDGQSGLAGATLTNSLVVEVEDRVGNPVSGTTVTFAVGTGGGTVSPTSGSSGTNGQVSVKATLGDENGPQTFVASAMGLNSVTFTETATLPVSSISISPINAQIQQGASQQYTATAIYTDGTTGDVTDQATWSTGNGGVATIGSTGVLVAKGAGTTTVTAAFGGKTGQTPVTVNAATLQSIVVTPANLSISVGTTAQMKATGTFSNQLVSDVTATCTWSSSNAGVATVSNTAGTQGQVTAKGAGTATISCALNGVTGSRQITVTGSPIVQLQVTPVNVVQPAGSAASFTATATFGDGTVQVVTSAAQWSSSDTTLMTLQNAPAQAGLATLLKAGTPDVIATYAGLTAQVQVTITSATVTSLSIAPPMANLAVNDTQQFTLQATYSDGTTGNVTTLASWTSSDASVADVSNATGSIGLVTGVSAGSATITASFGGQTASASVDVNDSMAVVLVVFQQGSLPMMLGPITVSCDAGQTLQLEAGTLNRGGGGRGMPTVVTSEASWSTSDGSVAVVENGSSGGLVQCLTSGTATITAAWENQSNTATVNVSAATVGSISIAPTSLSLAPGGAGGLHATGTLSDGSTQNLTTLGTWSSSNTAVATVSNASGSNGIVTGVGAGTATITFTYEGVTATVMVTVSGAMLTNVIISPANPEVMLRTGGGGPGGGRSQTLQLDATALFSDGSTQNVTALATWSISNPTGTTVATISNQSPTQGEATIDAVGTCTVSVTYSGMTGATTLTVY